MPVYNTKFILLNGPKFTGKSSVIAPTIVEAIKAKFPDDEPNVVSRDSFAGPLKLFIAAALGTPYEEMNKDRPEGVLNGYSVREFLIAMAETHIKPIYGKDIYGRWLVHRTYAMNPPPHFVVIDDCGFEEEVDGLGQGRKNIVLVRVERPGHDFRGDSRGYISDANAMIKNDTDIPALVEECRRFVDLLIE